MEEEDDSEHGDEQVELSPSSCQNAVEKVM